jgi:multidrug efflux system membrane fusion protein
MKIKNFYFLYFSMLVLSACGKKTEVQSLPQNHHIAVKLANVRTQNFNTEIKGAGLVSSSQEAKLSFKIGGVIQKIYVQEGETIRKGQILASLNLTEINLQVAQAEEGLQKAQRDYDRVQKLFKDSVATLEQSQNVATALNIARQNVEIAKYNQNYATIVASTDGVVLRKLMNEGEIVGVGSPLLFVNAVGNADWVLKIGVSDRDWAVATIGNVAEIYLDAYPNTVFEGKIKMLSQGADAMTGSYQLEIAINPQDKKLATGMFGKAIIQTEKARSYHIIPVASIVEGNGKNAFVFVPDGEKVKKLPIQIQEIQGNEVLVNSGLDNIQQVIYQGAGFLSANSKIVVK